jgi:hypothetical protein
MQYDDDVPRVEYLPTARKTFAGIWHLHITFAPQIKLFPSPIQGYYLCRKWKLVVIL